MKWILLTAIITLTACSGYRMQSRSNPFARYGIKSLHIPMFYNQSSLANVSPVFNKEITKILLGFKDLELSRGYENSDAVLIGIVSSAAKRRDTISKVTSTPVIDSFGENSIGENRKDFQVSSMNQVRLRLRVIVIKHPTQNELKFLQTSLGKNILNSKIIFNETINVTENYTLKVLEQDSFEVVGTQNRGIQRETKKSLALKASRSFKDMILYAF